MSQEQPSTYFVHNHQKEELKRLTIQDQMITEAMGGVLAEQNDPSVFHQVLDIACGTGGWVIEAAKQYPGMSLVGIDMSQKMIEYARRQAKGNDQIEFLVMDALHQLAFPDDSFDLVNLRFGVSFIRIWEWPEVISEMLRVTKSGGVVRVTDSGIVQQSNSPDLKKFQERVMCALDRAGHLFGENESGITTHLAPLLTRYGVREVQTKGYTKAYQADKAFIEDVSHAMKTLKPFIQRWGCVGSDYEQVCQMAREQMNNSNFHAVWELLTAWGIK